MLSTNSALITAISDNTSIKAVPKVVLEYNMNEMAGSVSVSTTGVQSNIIKELFPKESIIESFRPSKSGIKYHIIGQQDVLTTYKTKDVPASRIYMADKSNPYRFFLAEGSASVTLSYKNKAGTSAQNILTNKICVKVERSYGSVAVAIGSYYTGTAPSDGVINIWLQPNGTWSTTEPTSYPNPISISSLTVSVTGASYTGIIEVSPKYVLDVSDRVTSVSISKDDSIGDNQLPIGMLTANSSSLSLSTILESDIVDFIPGDSIVSNKVMILPNIKFTVYVIIDDTYSIQQGVFYVNEFKSDNYGNYSISGLDAAKFLQEINCPEILINDSSFQSIVWRLLDSVGFVDYDFTKCQSDILSCRFWWSNKTKTVWQAIQELCRESQTIAFIDEYGKLIFIDRNSFYNKDSSVAWTFRSTEGSGNRKPDIISMDSVVTPTTNAVKIQYNIPTTSNLEQSAQPVWTEQSPSTLFAAPYMGISNGYIVYPNRSVFADVIPTRFNSYVLINEEIIEYDGIQFSTPEGNVDITSSGQYLEYRAKYDNRVVPTGKLKIKTRNSFGTPSTSGSPVQNRDLASKGFSAKSIVLGSAGTQTESLSKVCSLNQGANNISALAISPSGDKHKFYIVSKDITCGGSALSSFEYMQIGTAIGFSLANSSDIGVLQTSGITFYWNPTTVSGYLLAIYSTRTAQNVDQVAEAVLYKIVNGSAQVLATVSSNIFEQYFYGVDILVHKETGKNTIFININGETSVLDGIVDASSPIQPTDNVGLMAGGQSVAYFDYLYASPKNDFIIDLSLAKSGGKILANSFFKDFKFENNQSSKLFFEEFGDVIREIYKAEAQYTQSYPIAAQATDTFAQIVGQRLSNQSGEFYVFNSSSSTIALSDGEGRDLFIYGKVVAPAGQNYFDSKDSLSSNKQITSFDAQWIQTKEAASSLSEFLTKQWSQSTSDVTLDIFGNPILQVGDIVSINYPTRGLDGSKKFVIKSIDHNISTGITTKITARSIYAG